jgi:hypothetical protein
MRGGKRHRVTRAAIDAELLIDVVEMDLDSSLVDEEFLADLHIAPPE